VTRRLLNLLTLLSLSLCVAVAGLWVRSCWRYDSIYVRHGGTLMGYVAARGQMELNWSPGVSAPGGAGRRTGPLPTGSRPGAGLWRFAAGRHRYWPGGQAAPATNYHVSLPHWCAAALFASLPACRLIASKRRRATRGTCPTCGYDLRAHPDRCPECGATP
jgi:hypothetical protein